MHPTVLALRGLIETAIGKQIEVTDAPTDRIGADGVRVWVWRIDYAESLLRSQHGIEPTGNSSGLRVSCLVFAPDLETLQAISTAAFDTPVAADGDQRVTVRHEALDTNLLLSLFIAAKVQLRPCLSFMLTMSPG